MNKYKIFYSHEYSTFILYRLDAHDFPYQSLPVQALKLTKGTGQEVRKVAQFEASGTERHT